MTIFKHEDFTLDLHQASKGKLYKHERLIFIGDGYTAIQILLRNCKDNEPVKHKFHSQLTMRQPSKFKEVSEK
jgi:hypothetical protein|tara:strand:+ start:211 stop:429 length:219 start_codon:yes stop_codon:yes gene_type:complete